MQQANKQNSNNKLEEMRDQQTNANSQTNRKQPNKPTSKEQLEEMQNTQTNKQTNTENERERDALCLSYLRKHTSDGFHARVIQPKNK